MSTCARCGWHHACPKCGHTSDEPWRGGRARRTKAHADAVVDHALIRRSLRALRGMREQVEWRATVYGMTRIGHDSHGVTIASREPEGDS